MSQSQTVQLHTQLTTGAEQLGVSLTEQQVEQLLAYLLLFAKWNAAYNLSAVRNIGDMVARHLLDSLSIMPYLGEGERCLDVGSGGGLPGIPLAIMYPQRGFTLLDSNGKKTRFLFQVKTELGLDNLEVQQARVEEYQPPQLFDAVFSRAFASLAAFLSGCERLVSDGAWFYAMKGQYPEDELREVRKPFNVEHCYPVRVPGETGARHLVVIKKQTGN